MLRWAMCLTALLILAGCVADSNPAPTSLPPSPTRVESQGFIVSSPHAPVESAPLRSLPTVAPVPSQASPAPTATWPPLPPAPRGVSGIEGHVFIGPVCPVARENEPCPDKPYQATFVVLNASRVEVKRFDTDAEGRFRLELPSGVYILVPKTAGRYPVAAEQTVQVVSGQFTAITITFDSGIR